MLPEEKKKCYGLNIYFSVGLHWLQKEREGVQEKKQKKRNQSIEN